MAASSPPAAARISRKTLWSSSGSGGTSSCCSTASSAAAASSSVLISCCASSRMPRVGIRGDRAGRGELALAIGEAREAARDRIDAREFHRQVAELVRAPEHLRVGEQPLDFACRSATRSSRRRIDSFIAGRAPCGTGGRPHRQASRRRARRRREAPPMARAAGGWSGSWRAARAPASGEWPAASRRRACSSVWSRAASAWPRSSRIIGTASSTLRPAMNSATCTSISCRATAASSWRALTFSSTTWRRSSIV